MAFLSKPEAAISNLRQYILKSYSVIAISSATVKGGRWNVGSFLEDNLFGRVVAILTERCAQIHTITATDHKLHRLAMMTGPNTTGKGPKWKISYQIAT